VISTDFIIPKALAKVINMMPGIMKMTGITFTPWSAIITTLAVRAIIKSERKTM